MDKLKKFLFVNSGTKQTVVKNIFWLFLSEILGRPLKMVLIIYTARTLGVEGWGVFSYAISVGALIMTFSDIGLGNLITREAIQKKEGYQTFISTAFLIKGIILFMGTLLVVFIGPHVSHIEEARMLFPLIALILFFDSMRNLGFAINLAWEKLEVEMLVTVITNGVVLILGIILLKIKPSPESIAIAYAIGNAVGFIVIAFAVRKNVGKFVSSVSSKTIKLVLQIVWPLALVTLIGSIMANTDVFMLGIWKTPGEIGLYASAQRMQQFILMLPSMIATATFPLLSRLAPKDQDQGRVTLEKTLVLIMAVGIPIVFGGIILANDIVPLIFGAEYAGAIPIMRIFMIALLAAFPLIVLSNTIFAYDKQKNIALAYSFGVLGNVLLNFLLIPSFGAVGSAVATLVSTTIITAVIWNKLKKIHYFEVLPKLKKILQASFVMTLLIFVFKYFGLHVIPNIIISALGYFSILLLLKEEALSEILGILKIVKTSA